MRKAERMEDTIEHAGRASDCLARLDHIVEEMAEATLPLVQSVTPERYRLMLSVCYQYTHSSGAQLERAAELAPSDDLKVFFATMADEERDHYRLAEADLAATGTAIGNSRLAAVDRFAAYWNEIKRENFFEFLGATYVLENVAGRLRKGAMAALASLGLNRRQSRFVLTHLEADQEHGARVQELCARYSSEHGAALLAGARAAAREWICGANGFTAETR